MTCTGYIQVILPLKLGWEPFYILPEGETVSVGDRVLAPFAGRSYLGVVSAVNVSPPEDLKRIIRIYGRSGNKAQIAPKEIEFWRSIASYYMCSVGEVYKAAYPSVKDETVTPRKKAEDESPGRDPELTDSQREAYSGIVSALDAGRNALLNAGDSDDILAGLCRKVQGCILWLVPETKFGRTMQERLHELLGSRLLLWNSDITPASKRNVLQKCRQGEPKVILGTRSAVFLPFRELKLVIVQEEHEVSYKQKDPAPHYNGRDAALILASIHKAGTVLQSATPSLESIFNSMCGKLTEVKTRCGKPAGIEIIDTRSEFRKNGMEGDLSKKLILALSSAGKAAVFKPRRAAFPDIEELRQSVQRHFGDRVAVYDDLVENPLPDDIQAVGILGLDALLGKEDFRADEKAVQTLSPAIHRKGLEKVLVQTCNSKHPAIQSICSGNCSAMMEERKQFGMPPFTRLVDIRFKDENIKRAGLMESRLLGVLVSAGFDCLPGTGMIRVSLKKNKDLPARKEMILRLVDRFEKENHYGSGIAFDVDPL